MFVLISSVSVQYGDADGVGGSMGSMAGWIQSLATLGHGVLGKALLGHHFALAGVSSALITIDIGIQEYERHGRLLMIELAGREAIHNRNGLLCVSVNIFVSSA